MFCNTTNHISSFVAMMWQRMLEVSPLSFPRTLLSTSPRRHLASKSRLLRRIGPSQRDGHINKSIWASSSSPEPRVVLSAKRSMQSVASNDASGLASRYLECRGTAIVRSTRNIAGRWCYSSRRSFSVSAFSVLCPQLADPARKSRLVKLSAM